MRVYKTCKDGKEYPEGGCQERARLVRASVRRRGKVVPELRSRNAVSSAVFRVKEKAVLAAEGRAFRARIWVVPR